MSKAQGQRPTIPKGKQTAIFPDRTDTLISMITALMGEVVVLRERLDAHERLAAKSGAFTKEDVDAFQPDDEALADRATWRERTIERVLYAIQKEIAAGENEGVVDEDIIDAVQRGDL